MVARIDIRLDPIDASMQLNQGESANLERILGSSKELRKWVREGLLVFDNEGQCTSEVQDAISETRDSKTFVTLRLTATCKGTPTRLVDNTIFDDDRQHESILRQQSERTCIMRKGRQSCDLDAPAGFLNVLGTFFWEGILHFASGIDHVFFLLALVVPFRLRGSEGLDRISLRHLLYVVTAFTVGHSITLVAASLSWIPEAPAWVEPGIAASIVLVASSHIVSPKPHRGLMWVSLLFGLVHGLGFFTVLSVVGLPPSQSLVALFSFNIGLEVGQLACIALVCPPLYSVAQSKHQQTIVRVLSAIIALGGLYFLYEQLR